MSEIIGDDDMKLKQETYETGIYILLQPNGGSSIGIGSLAVECPECHKQILPVRVARQASMQDMSRMAGEVSSQIKEINTANRTVNGFLKIMKKSKFSLRR